MSIQDREKIAAGIRDKYKKVAAAPKSHFKYPAGRDGLKGLHYDKTLITDLPDAVADSFCGVGNPFSLGNIRSGDFVPDIGCGSGVDALLAAKLVGTSGKVLGIDMTKEMIQKANSNRKIMNANNIGFQVSRVQDLTGPEERFDVVISNGVTSSLIKMMPFKPHTDC